MSRADQPASAPTDTPRVLWFLHAMGRLAPPPTLRLARGTYSFERVVKHDFFACTSFYVNESGQRVVLKVGRVAPLGVIPMRWLGRRLTRHETRFYRSLADLPNVPALLGMLGDCAFVHDFAPGQPLSREANVPDVFFDRLDALIAELHRRGMAYVDTNKPQNVIAGDDGLPHLVDFQISVDGSGDRLLRLLVRLVLPVLQEADRYHLAKHRRKLRPHTLTGHAGARPPLPIRLHRALTKPYFVVRRRVFGKLRRSGRLLAEHGER